MEDVFTAARIASPAVRAATLFLSVAEKERLLKPSGISGRAILFLARGFATLPVFVQDLFGKSALYSLACLYIGFNATRRRPVLVGLSTFVLMSFLWWWWKTRRRELHS